VPVPPWLRAVVRHDPVTHLVAAPIALRMYRQER
jgi:hypothetical protein